MGLCAAKDCLATPEAVEALAPEPTGREAAQPLPATSSRPGAVREEARKRRRSRAGRRLRLSLLLLLVDSAPRLLPELAVPLPELHARRDVAEATCGEASIRSTERSTEPGDDLPVEEVASTVPEEPVEAPAAEQAAKADELIALLEPGRRLGALSDFAKAFCTRELCLRLLRKYGGDTSRSAAKLEAMLRWRQSNEGLLTSLQFQESSDLRVIGFDAKGHPMLYHCARNQLLPNSRALDQYVVRMVQAIDMMPPGVSTMTHIWDMHGMRIMLNLNPGAVVHLLSVLEGYFAERMHELLIIDAPRAAQFIIDAIWPVVPERTRKKVFFLSSQEALQHLAESCLAPLVEEIGAVMALNRDPTSSLAERRRSWKQVDAFEVQDSLVGA